MKFWKPLDKHFKSGLLQHMIACTCQVFVIATVLLDLSLTQTAVYKVTLKPLSYLHMCWMWIAFKIF